MALLSSLPEASALVEGLPSKSEKIRRLSAAGYSRSQIADFLGVRYQFVRNVLVDAERRSRSNQKSDEPALSGSLHPTRLKIGSNGVVALPEAFRNALRVKEGDTLIASIEGDGEVRLLTLPAAVRQAQAIVRKFVPEGVSLVDELIADRRREVEREESERD